MDWTAVQLLESTLGPQGSKVLVETANGSQSLSSLGVELINLFKPVNPLLVRGAQETEHVLGDRVKSYILITTVALLQTVRESQKYDREILIQVLKQFEEFSVEIADSIESERTSCRNVDKVTFAVRQAVIMTSSKDKKSLQISCLKIISTSLGNSCSYVAKKKLKEVLMEVLFPEGHSFSDMEEYVIGCQRALSHNYLLHVPSSVTNTIVERGFLLDSSHPHVNTGVSLRAVLLLSGLEIESSQAHVEINSKHQLQKLCHFQDHFTNRLAEHLAQNNIRLLLSGGNLSTQIFQVLMENRIGVIQMIPEETLVSIAETNHTHPFSDPIEMLHSEKLELSTMFIQCVPLVIGKKKCTLLKTTPLSGVSCDPPAYILCAPTLSQAHTLHKLIQRALTLLKNWLHLKSKSGGLVGVAGGGVWEIELIREMNKYISTQQLVRGSPRWIALNSLIQGYLSVPHALYTNSLPPQSRKLSRIMKQFHNKVFDVTDKSLIGLDILNGGLEPVRLVSDWPVLEPVSSLEYLFSAVCRFLSQALRVDHVINVPIVTQESSIKENMDEEN